MTLGDQRERLGIEAYKVLAVDPAFCISYQFFISVLLFLALFYGSLQDPAKGFVNHHLSLVDNAVSPTSGLVAFDDTATVSTSAVAGGVLRDWGGRHDFSVQGETLHWCHDCSCHFDIGSE